MKNFTLRQSQALNTFGVGAIVDFNQQSVIPTCEWANNRPEGLGATIEENYLLNEIRHDYPQLTALYPYPEVRSDAQIRTLALSARRFPDWLYCPTCGKLRKYGTWLSEFRRIFTAEASDTFANRPYCPYCREKKRHRVPLMPTRFVVACKHGHLSDFPWAEWCHHDSDTTCCDDLRLDSGAGEGISSIKVICDKCHTAQPLTHAFGRNGLSTIMPHCHGDTPWKGKNRRDKVPCTAAPMVVQRGGSNIYYPLVRTSISLPAAKQSIKEQVLSLKESIQIVDYYRSLITPPVEGVLAPPPVDVGQAFENAWNVAIGMLRYPSVCEHNGIDVEQAKKILHAECSGSNEESELNNRDSVEFDTFSHEYNEGVSSLPILNVIEQNVADLDDDIARFISRANLITRLRVVSVLTHFTRLLPPNGSSEQGEGNEAEAVQKQLAFYEKSSWLPAYQGYGEGIFIALNPERVENWLKDHAVVAECSKMRLENPAYVLVHTFSHFLMKALSVCCGYSLTALQEKIYSNPNEHQYGLLIYTSAPDIHGTLGGLVRQGDIKELSALIRNAVLDARTCSNDPICSETAVDPQAFSSAACYACAFIPETSCCNFNRYLNRHFLVHAADAGKMHGFFNELI